MNRRRPPPPVQPIDPREAERLAVAEAEAEAVVVHEELMVWIERLAAGELGAPPPIPWTVRLARRAGSAG